MTTRGLELPGQLTKAGTRTPPSYRLPLPPRNGALEAGVLRPLDAALFGSRSSLLWPRRNSAAGRAAVVAGEEDDRVVAQPLLSSAATIRPT